MFYSYIHSNYSYLRHITIMVASVISSKPPFQFIYKETEAEKGKCPQQRLVLSGHPIAQVSCPLPFMTASVAVPCFPLSITYPALFSSQCICFHSPLPVDLSRRGNLLPFPNSHFQHTGFFFYIQHLL